MNIKQMKNKKDIRLKNNSFKNSVDIILYDVDYTLGKLLNNI